MGPRYDPGAVPPENSPRGRLVRRIALAIGAVVCALGLAEVALRVASPSYAERKADYRIRPMRTAQPTWLYEPGSEIVFTWDGDPNGVLPDGAVQRIPVNAFGVRGALPPAPLAADPRPRVVMLGDSFTFGEGVELEDTFVRRVERRLGREGASGPRLFNAGVAGHGTVEEAARVPHILTTYAPTAIVLVFVPNDAIHFSESAERGADLLNAATPGGLRLLGLWGRGEAAAATDAWYRSYYLGERREHWDRAAGALGSMANQCRDAGVRFGVAIFPLLHALDAYPFTEIHTEVRKACAQREIPVIDLLDAFAGRDAAGLWVHPADRHPNLHAHEIVAAPLADFTRELLR